MKNKVSNAWGKVIAAYKAARINSERTMQAVLFAELTKQLDESYHLLCEPVLDMPNLGRYVPDIVITSGDSIQAVFELKFVPHHYPVTTDLEKLKHYAQATHKFPVLLNPETGRFSKHDFSFAPDCLLVFAVIGRSDSKAVDTPTIEASMADFRERFLHLALPVGQ